MRDRRHDKDVLLDLDFLFDPMVTQRVLAAIDKSDDPHLQIDILRRAVYQLAGKISQMGNAIKILQDAERERKNWTESGIYKVVEEQAGKKAVNWAAVQLKIGLGAALLALLGLVLKLAWKGLHT